MTTQEQRAEWRELADDGGLSEGNEIVLALLADMDALTQERDAAYRAIERMSRKQTEMHDTLQARNAALTAERDALAAELARVRGELAQAESQIYEMGEQDCGEFA
jgi:predicted  nucleic acid-binding Zn-ribbon protein